MTKHIPEPEWYLKPWHPYGVTIHYHYVGYVEVNGRTVAINRHHERGTDAIMFYVPNGYVDEKCDSYRLNTWTAVCRWLREVFPTAVPLT